LDYFGDPERKPIATRCDRCESQSGKLSGTAIGPVPIRLRIHPIIRFGQPVDDDRASGRRQTQLLTGRPPWFSPGVVRTHGRLG